MNRSAGNWTVRPARADDEPFLRRLYATTRQQELADWGWDSAAQAAFVDLQFRAQRAHYQREWPQASDEIVLVGGLPVGRRLTDRGAGGLRLVDIALLPDQRGRGLGAALVRELLVEADRTGQSLSLQVQAGNPAQRLYERLGLRVTDRAAAPYVAMRWPPGKAPRPDTSGQGAAEPVLVTWIEP